MSPLFAYVTIALLALLAGGGLVAWLFWNADHSDFIKRLGRL